MDNLENRFKHLMGLEKAELVATILQLENKVNTLKEENTKLNQTLFSTHVKIGAIKKALDGE